MEVDFSMCCCSYLESDEKGLVSGGELGRETDRARFARRLTDHLGVFTHIVHLAFLALQALLQLLKQGQRSHDELTVKVICISLATRGQGH